MTPVRTTSCKHVDTVDLQAFLKSCPKSDLISLFAKYKLSSKVDSLLTCPLCKAKGSLYVDAIIENFIRSNPSEESILFSIKNQGEHTFLYGSVLSSEVANRQSNEPTIKVSSASDNYQEEAMLNVKPLCVETMTSPRSPPLWWESHQSQPQRSPALWWETQGTSPHPCKTPIYTGTSTAPCNSPIYGQIPSSSCKSPMYSQAPTLTL